MCHRHILKERGDISLNMGDMKGLKKVALPAMKLPFNSVLPSLEDKIELTTLLTLTEVLVHLASLVGQ